MSRKGREEKPSLSSATLLYPFQPSMQRRNQDNMYMCLYISIVSLASGECKTEIISFKTLYTLSLQNRIVFLFNR